MLFLGEGSGRRPAVRASQTRCLPGRISFPGFVKDVHLKPDGSRFLRIGIDAGRAIQLPASRAMSAGVIPIVFDASGVRDVVDHGRTGRHRALRSAELCRGHARRHALCRLRAGARWPWLRASSRKKSIGIDAIAARTLQAVGRAAHSRQARA